MIYLLLFISFIIGLFVGSSIKKNGIKGKLLELENEINGIKEKLKELDKPKCFIMGEEVPENTYLKSVLKQLYAIKNGGIIVRKRKMNNLY